jgi:DNA-binding NarL/FixJ family response regulator
MTARKLPPLPLPLDKWASLLSALQLPLRQQRIVELILRNQCDKQIADMMGLKVPTVRTYKTRIFHRLDVSDRVELILFLFALSHDITPENGRAVGRGA